MKRKLTVNDQTYEVEIEDIRARPIVVYVDGVRFEIMPEEEIQAPPKSEAGKPIKSETQKPNPISAPAPPSGPAVNHNVLASPLPGTVAGVFVKEGDKVEAGQVVLIIEAMKMKNSIRAPRGGTIGEVLVSEGQSVAHKQALIKFAEIN